MSEAEGGLTEADIRNAVQRMAKSERGLKALKGLNRWLNEDGLGLDSSNQDAVLTLLLGAWGSLTGEVREQMQAAQPATKSPRKQLAGSR